MMNAEEQEYMDYLIHNRTQLTNEITRHLDEIDVLQKKLDIAVKALEEIERKSDKFDDSWSIQEQLDWIKAKCQETLYCLKEFRRA